MLRIPQDGEDLKINNYTNNPRPYKFNHTTNTFPCHDLGGKISKFYQENEKIIFKVAGHNSRYELGVTKYYPPFYMIGTLTGDTFNRYYEVEYTRKYAKQAKEKALELVAAINTKEK